MEGIGAYTNCLKIYLQSQEINRQSHFETNTVNYFLTTSFTSSITAKCRCRDPVYLLLRDQGQLNTLTCVQLYYYSL